MLNIVLFGPPGAGKGTQSQKIIDKFNLDHISTGEILRKAISEGTTMGIKAASFIDDGNYIPDDMAIDILKAELDNYSGSNGFIFDGFPRTTYQAEIFSGILSKFGGDVNLMISLDVDEKVLVERLVKRSKESCRPDDREEAIIQKRIGIYNDRTALVADYYKSLGKHESINGNGEIDIIFDKICEAIEKHI